MVLRNDGTVWCWGRNSYGQLGNGTTTDSLTPVQYQVSGHAVAIAAGGYHSVVLLDNATLWCSGLNEDGELGQGYTDPYNWNAPPPPPPHMTHPNPLQIPNFSVLPQVAAPQFAAGTESLDGSTRPVTVTCATIEASIHFTLDGSTPTQNSPSVAAGGTVTVSQPGTLNAGAWFSNMTPSPITSATYVPAGVKSYNYDAIGRLQSTVGNAVTTSFGYDNNGNILSVTNN
jgi:YD repeat-containing protein